LQEDCSRKRSKIWKLNFCLHQCQFCCYIICWAHTHTYIGSLSGVE